MCGVAPDVAFCVSNHKNIGNMLRQSETAATEIRAWGVCLFQRRCWPKGGGRSRRALRTVSRHYHHYEFEINHVGHDRVRERKPPPSIDSAARRPYIIAG